MGTVDLLSINLTWGFKQHSANCAHVRIYNFTFRSDLLLILQKCISCTTWITKESEFTLSNTWIPTENQHFQRIQLDSRLKTNTPSTFDHQEEIQLAADPESLACLLTI